MTDNRAPAQSEVRPFYRPDIDGLRAIAIIGVVLYHASTSLLPGGFIGVDIFFVISGFLISSLIFKELDQGRFRFGDFYIRRIRRIFPALILMMIAVWTAGCFLLTKNEFAQLGQHMLAGGAFSSNLLQWRYAGYFDTDAQLKPLQHLWSLGIEEQFYIVWPVTVVLLWHKRFRTIVLSVMLLSFAFNIVRTPHHATGAFFLPVGRAWELLLGSMLAYQDRYGRLPSFLSRDREIHLPLRRGKIAMRDIAAALALVLLAIGFCAIHSDSQFPGWWVLLPTFAAFLIIWAGECAWLNARLLAHPAMVFVGLISYPLYIWHWPLLSLLRIVGNGEPSAVVKIAAVVAAILLSILTYLLVERPLRRSRVSRAAIVAVLVAAMVAISGLGALSYLQLIQTPRMAKDAAAEAAAKRAWYRTSDCSSFLDKNAPSFEWCRIWGDPTLKKTYVIWGDSHAHSWSAGAATLAEQRGARLVEYSHPACPPLLGVRRITQNLGKACDDFHLADSILQQIKGLAPSRILLVGRWTFYTRHWAHEGESDLTYITADPQGEATADTSIAALKAKIPQTLWRLAQIGKVVIIKTVPTLHSSIEVGLARDPNGYEPTLAEYRAVEAAPNAIIDQAVRDIPGVSVLDPAALMCKQNKCHAILNGVRLYEDDYTHLSDAGALLFLPELLTLTK